MVPVVLLAAGCRRDEGIRTYRVAKESAPGVETMDPHAIAGAHPPVGAVSEGNPHGDISMEAMPVPPRTSGEVPGHWSAGRLSAMRLAGYSVSSDDGEVADVSLASLGGMAGGTLENVNRWRGQIGLPPVDDLSQAGEVETVANPRGEVWVVDIVGRDSADKRDGRIIAGILPLEEETWFFKMRGAPGLVGREKAAFLRWIATAEPIEP